MNWADRVSRAYALPLIALVSSIVWWGSLDNSFHYDDEHSILLNINLRLAPDAGEIAAAVAHYFSDPAAFSRDEKKGMYRPLLITTFGLNHAANLALGLDGYDVRSFHVVNLLIHVLNALLLYWLAGLLWPKYRQIGLWAGWVWAVWPVTAEPVNYISSRSESLAALFYLLGLCLFLRGARTPASRWWWGTWVAMLAGLLTKSTLITFPAALLLMDGTRRDGLLHLKRRFLRWHLPGWLLAGGYILVISLNGFLGRSLGAPVRDAWHQALTQAKAIGYYLQLATVPVHLSVEPQFREQGTVTPVVIGGLLLVLTLILGAGWLLRRRYATALALLGVGVLHMLPSMVMPLNVLVNERRAYFPTAILCVGVVALLIHHAVRPVRLIASIGFLVAAILSVQQTRVWADSASLWTVAARRAPQMPRPHLYMGNTYKDRALRTQDPGQRRALWQQAAAEYEKTLALPGDLDLRLRGFNNLGGVQFELGNMAAAEEVFRRAVAEGPHYADALINLGNSLLKKARVEGDAVSRQQLLAEAVDYYERGLVSEQHNYYGYANLGVALQDLGRTEEAEAAYRRALFLYPKHVGSLTNLAALLLSKAEQTTDAAARRRFLDEAHRSVKYSLSLNPAQERAREILRLVETGRGRDSGS